MVPSVAWAPRTVSAIVGMKRASTYSCHPHADGELVSVAIVRQQHAAGTQEAYRTHQTVVGGTQCTPLSAAVKKRRCCGSMPGPSRASLPHGVCKACRRLRETGGADPWCGPSLTTQVSYRLAYSSTMLTPSALARRRLTTAMACFPEAT